MKTEHVLPFGLAAGCLFLFMSGSSLGKPPKPGPDYDWKEHRTTPEGHYVPGQWVKAHPGVPPPGTGKPGKEAFRPGIFVNPPVYPYPAPGTPYQAPYVYPYNPFNPGLAVLPGVAYPFVPYLYGGLYWNRYGFSHPGWPHHYPAGKPYVHPGGVWHGPYRHHWGPGKPPLAHGKIGPLPPGPGFKGHKRHVGPLPGKGPAPNKDQKAGPPWLKK